MPSIVSNKKWTVSSVVAVRSAKHIALLRPGAVISVCLKNELKTKIATLSKALFEQQKQQAANNKKHATAAVTSAAQKVSYLII